MWSGKHKEFHCFLTAWSLLQSILQSHVCMLITSVLSNSLWPCGPWPASLLCPWNSPPKNIGVGCVPFSRESSEPGMRRWDSGWNPSLLQLLQWEEVLYHQHHVGSPLQSEVRLINSSCICRYFVLNPLDLHSFLASIIIPLYEQEKWISMKFISDQEKLRAQDLSDHRPIFWMVTHPKPPYTLCNPEESHALWSYL